MTTVNLKDAGARLGQIKLQNACKRGLYSAALRGVTEIVTFIIPSRSPQPVDRGLYRSGWRATKTSEGASIENLEPHAVWIEEGVKNVRLGPAAFQAIAAWAIRKGLATSQDALTVAARIIHAMRRRGHIFGPRGMGILRELREGGKLQQYIQEEVEREVVKAIRRGVR